MPKYIKRPVEIEAVQVRWGNLDDLRKFLGDHFQHSEAEAYSDTCGEQRPFLQLSIKTLEGVMIARHGDYVIKGVFGEFYPCKPDIFDMTYMRSPAVPSTAEEGK